LICAFDEWLSLAPAASSALERSLLKALCRIEVPGTAAIAGDTLMRIHLQLPDAIIPKRFSLGDYSHVRPWGSNR